jgi:hypothetical protein
MQISELIYIRPVDELVYSRPTGASTNCHFDQLPLRPTATSPPRVDHLMQRRHKTRIPGDLKVRQNPLELNSDHFPRACIIKLITAVIYSFPNQLERLSINTRLGCKGLPGTNTLDFYGKCNLQP